MGEVSRGDGQNALWVDGTNCPRREQTYFDEMKRSGVTASVITSPHWDSGFYKGIQDVLGDLQWIEDSEGRAILATSVSDIKRARHEGKAAIILAPQDGKIIEDQLGFLKVFHSLGIRILELSHMRSNFIGDGTIDAHFRKESGLSLFGVDVVKEMNRLGVVIDVAHSGHQTTMEAIAASDHPAIFSHANVFSLCDNVRNKRDEAIEALAKKGGVMGITVYAQFCETKRGVWPTIEDFVRHIDYVSDLVGVDHVGIALDIDEVGYTKEPVHGLTYATDAWADFNRRYPGMTRPPYDEWAPPSGYPLVKGMESIACYPDIAKGLSKRSYSETDVEKIMGGNWLRVFEEVWGG